MTSSLLFNITTFTYLISMLCFFVHLASRNEHAGTAGSYTAYSGLLVQTVAILLRWKESYDLGMGHAPLSNLYESVVFFAWTIILIFAFVDFKYRYGIIGAFVVPFALFGMSWALASGMFTGALTCTPALAAAMQKVIDEGEARFMVVRRLLRRARDAGYDIALCLDEFEALAHNPHGLAVHQAIWKTLRTMNLDPALVDRYVDLAGQAVFYLDPHVCVHCRYRSTELLWQCPHCHEWNTFVEERVGPAGEAR